MHIQYSRSHTEEELMEILALQKQNSPTNFSEEEKQKEGFITILHSFDQLKNLNDDCPHIIAKFEGKVIGYALCMTKKFAKEIPLLTSMFENADILLKEKSYLAMGQIFVSKDFRGKGVFRAMYRFYRKELHKDYEFLVTEVAASNRRSLNAHMDIGFKVLQTHILEDISWKFICWDWN